MPFSSTAIHRSGSHIDVGTVRLIANHICFGIKRIKHTLCNVKRISVGTIHSHAHAIVRSVDREITDYICHTWRSGNMQQKCIYSGCRNTGKQYPIKKVYIFLMGADPFYYSISFQNVSGLLIASHGCNQILHIAQISNIMRSFINYNVMPKFLYLLLTILCSLPFKFLI